EQWREHRRRAHAVAQRLPHRGAVRFRHQLGDAKLRTYFEHHRIDDAKPTAGHADRIEDAIVSHDHRIRAGKRRTDLGVLLALRERIAIALDPYLFSAREY